MAKEFCRKDGFLLVISGLNNAKCIVPKNRYIRFSSAKCQREREILFKKGINLKIERINGQEIYAVIQPEGYK